MQSKTKLSIAVSSNKAHRSGNVAGLARGSGNFAGLDFSEKRCLFDVGVPAPGKSNKSSASKLATVTSQRSRGVPHSLSEEISTHGFLSTLTSRPQELSEDPAFSHPSSLSLWSLFSLNSAVLFPSSPLILSIKVCKISYLTGPSTTSSFSRAQAHTGIANVISTSF